MEHQPVLLDEVLKGFADKGAPYARFFDGTFGRGGHFAEVLSKFNVNEAIGCDGDLAAIDFGQDRFKQEIESGQVKLVHRSYTEFEALVGEDQVFPTGFDLMLVDLGVSSPQLDVAERGFSFYNDGPLDMRMDQRQEISAATIINEWHQDDLIRMFQDLGEIRKPYRVVRAIVNDREKKAFERTLQLSSLIERVEGWRRKGSHPATRFFLALRMEVNKELGGLEESLPHLMKGLNEGGRLAVITFHSLEDRIVKNIFRSRSDIGRPVNKKVIKPSDEEAKQNPRARSAKLRLFEKGIGDES